MIKSVIEEAIEFWKDYRGETLTTAEMESIFERLSTLNPRQACLFYGGFGQVYHREALEWAKAKRYA